MLAPYIAQIGNPEQLTLKFRFQVNGVTNPDFVLPGSCVIDVVRTGVGVFEIAFAEKYPVFVGLVGNVLAATPVSDLQVKAGVANYVATTGKLTVTVVDSGVAAAADPVDNDWVYCEVTVCRRSRLSDAVAI